MEELQHQELEEITTRLYYPDGTIESWTERSLKDFPTQEVATNSSSIVSQTKEGVTRSLVRMNGKLPESYTEEGWTFDAEQPTLITQYPDGSSSILCPVIRRHKGFKRWWGSIIFWTGSIFCLPLLLNTRVRAWFRSMLYEQQQLMVFKARAA